MDSSKPSDIAMDMSDDDPRDKHEIVTGEIVKRGLELFTQEDYMGVFSALKAPEDKRDEVWRSIGQVSARTHLFTAALCLLTTGGDRRELAQLVGSIWKLADALMTPEQIENLEETRRKMEADVYKSLLENPDAPPSEMSVIQTP